MATPTPRYISPPTTSMILNRRSGACCTTTGSMRSLFRLIGRGIHMLSYPFDEASSYKQNAELGNSFPAFETGW